MAHDNLPPWVDYFANIPGNAEKFHRDELRHVAVLYMMLSMEMGQKNGWVNIQSHEDMIRVMLGNGSDRNCFRRRYSRAYEIFSMLVVQWRCMQERAAHEAAAHEATAHEATARGAFCEGHPVKIQSVSNINTSNAMFRHMEDRNHRMFIKREGYSPEHPNAKHSYEMEDICLDFIDVDNRIFGQVKNFKQSSSIDVGLIQKTEYAMHKEGRGITFICCPSVHVSRKALKEKDGRTKIVQTDASYMDLWMCLRMGRFMINNTPVERALSLLGPVDDSNLDSELCVDIGIDPHLRTQSHLHAQTHLHAQILTKIEPHSYQHDMANMICDMLPGAFLKFNIPCGAGKTFGTHLAFAELCKRRDKQTRMVFFAPRVDLMVQTAEVFSMIRGGKEIGGANGGANGGASCRISGGVIADPVGVTMCGGGNRAEDAAADIINGKATICICVDRSAGRLATECEDRGVFFDLCVMDEAHHYDDISVKDQIRCMEIDASDNNACDMDAGENEVVKQINCRKKTSKDMMKFFVENPRTNALPRVVMISATLREHDYNVDARMLINDGILCPYTIDLLGWRKVPSTLGIAEVLLDSTYNHCLVYAGDRQEGKEFTEFMKTKGELVEYIDGTTPGDERQELIEMFRKGKTRFLVSIGVLTEGFNATIASTCVFLRHRRSEICIAQIVGRVMRTHPGKTCSRVVVPVWCDCSDMRVSNTLTQGTRDILRTLKRGLSPNNRNDGASGVGNMISFIPVPGQEWSDDANDNEYLGTFEVNLMTYIVSSVDVSFTKKVSDMIQWKEDGRKRGDKKDGEDGRPGNFFNEIRNGRRKLTPEQKSYINERAPWAFQNRRASPEDIQSEMVEHHEEHFEKYGRVANRKTICMFSDGIERSIGNFRNEVKNERRPVSVNHLMRLKAIKGFF